VAEALLTAADQFYFWTPEWQAGERMVDKAIAEGRVRDFGAMEADRVPGYAMRFQATEPFWKAFAELPPPAKEKARIYRSP